MSIVFNSIDAIEAHSFAGHHAADAEAFAAIHTFVLDESQPMADRAHALDFMLEKDKGITRNAGMTDEDVVTDYVAQFTCIATATEAVPVATESTQVVIPTKTPARGRGRPRKLTGVGDLAEAKAMRAKAFTNARRKMLQEIIARSTKAIDVHTRALKSAKADMEAEFHPSAEERAASEARRAQRSTPEGFHRGTKVKFTEAAHELVGLTYRMFDFDTQYTVISVFKPEVTASGLTEVTLRDSEGDKYGYVVSSHLEAVKS